MAYYNTDEMHADLKRAGYTLITRKPWNVREDDVIILSDASRPPYLSTLYIPVYVHIVDHYQDFSRPYPYRETARSHYRFYHKPLNPEDLRFLYNRHHTAGWNRFDDVEIYRKTSKTTTHTPTTPKN